MTLYDAILDKNPNRKGWHTPTQIQPVIGATTYAEWEERHADPKGKVILAQTHALDGCIEGQRGRVYTSGKIYMMVWEQDTKEYEREKRS